MPWPILPDHCTQRRLYRSIPVQAEVLLGMRQADEALTDVEKALNCPEEEALYLLRGQIHESQDNLDAAQ